MPSQESHALEELFYVFQKIRDAGPEILQDKIMSDMFFEQVHKLASEPEDVTYAEIKCPGTVRPAIWVLPVGAPKDAAFLYIHGGGFAAGSPSIFRKMVAHIAKAAGIPALIIDYRKSPEYKFPKALEDCTDAYRWLMEDQGIPAQRIATMGDLAGSNLAITTVLNARKLGLPLPGAVVAISPWVDMEVNGDTLNTNGKTDPTVHPEWLKKTIAEYLQPSGASPKDPLFNPLYADMKGFPPCYLTCGTREALLDNSHRFAKVARDAGVEVTIEEAEGLFHTHTYMVGRAPEADQTVGRIGQFLKEKLSG